MKTIDLKSITRNADKVITRIWLLENSFSYPQGDPWIELGECSIMPHGDRDPTRWRLKAYLPAGWTDFEHDSGYALGLELIGLSFVSVDYGRTELSGYIDPDPDGGRNFRIPPEDYDPLKGTTMCKECEKPHPIVEYQVPRNPKLFANLRGRKVHIFIGAPSPKEKNE